ncbi:MAG: DUF5683 domain-containing protein [Flavobacteriales bacterium]
MRVNLFLASLLLSSALATAQSDSTATEGAVDAPAPVSEIPAVVEADPGSSGSTIPTDDTLNWRQRHSPPKATILSAVIPGAGQIYNRKYWKAPIAWAGLGISLYFIQDNQTQYRRYKDAYIAVVDGDPNTVDEFNGEVSSSQLLDLTDTYRKWRDMSYIAFGLVYILNVVDANVDAHFVRFDVSRDLTVGLGPSLHTASLGAPGLSLAMTLR